MFDIPFFDFTANAQTNNLAFLNSSSFDSNGVEYTGDNGYVVTDSYSCGSGACGGFEMGSHPAGYVAPVWGADSTGLAPVAITHPVDPVSTTNLTFEHTSSFDSNGVEYTGNNGYVVTDSYSCGDGQCGGFSMGSFPAGVLAADSTSLAPVAASHVAPVNTTNLAFEHSSSFDSNGVEYTGDNGYVVTDSYSCGSGACGGFEMGSHPAGYVAPVWGADSTGLAPVAVTQAPATSLTGIDPACAPGTGGSDGTCFTVEDPHHAGEGYTVWTNEYEGKMTLPELAPAAPVTPELKEAPAVGQKLLEGKPVASDEWHQEFSKVSEEAVNSVSPVGGYILKQSVLSK